jgi:predicted N-acetyltransferase YhbS
MENNQLSIREMSLSDADRVVEMTRAVSAHEGLPPPKLSAATLVHYALSQPPLLKVFVADCDGEIVGHVMATHGFDVQSGSPSLWLADLYVEPAWRGRGIGRQLVASVAAIGAAEGAAFLQWMIDPRNNEAQAFYNSLGSRLDGGVSMFLDQEEIRQLATEAT